MAEGSDPLVYQWRRNGTLVAGATAPTYTTPTTESDDGATFSVVVSNSAKFITPMVADGRVFVGTTNGVAVFGLLN